MTIESMSDGGAVQRLERGHLHVLAWTRRIGDDARPAWSPASTSRRIDRAASSCQVRRLDRGLYSATARSLPAIARSRLLDDRPRREQIRQADVGVIVGERRTEERRRGGCRGDTG